jgi:hypothetical protein
VDIMSLWPCSCCGKIIDIYVGDIICEECKKKKPKKELSEEEWFEKLKECRK